MSGTRADRLTSRRAATVELLDMAVGEGPKRASRRGRSPHPSEEPGRGPVAKNVEVVDAVRACEHPRADADGLDHRVRCIDAQTSVE